MTRIATDNIEVLRPGNGKRLPYRPRTGSSAPKYPRRRHGRRGTPPGGDRARCAEAGFPAGRDAGIPQPEGHEWTAAALLSAYAMPTAGRRGAAPGMAGPLDDRPPVFPTSTACRSFSPAAARGIGAELTRGFLEQGAQVTFVQRSDASGFVDEMEVATGNRPTFIPCDVTDTDALRRAISRTSEIQGPVTVLVSNAANDQRHSTLEVDEDFWEWSTAINLKSYFFAAQGGHSGHAGRRGRLDHPLLIDQLHDGKRGLPGLRGVEFRHQRPRPVACPRVRWRPDPRQRARPGLGADRQATRDVGDRGRPEGPYGQDVPQGAPQTTRYRGTMPLSGLLRIGGDDRAGAGRRRRRRRHRMTGSATYCDWVAVDWGTSTLRAWAMRGAEMVAEARSDSGMNSLDKSQFEAALLKLVDPWLGGRPMPVVACGMAGARQGWTEVPYRTVPCMPLGGGVAVPTSDTRLSVTILPGLKQDNPADVMRGEETQVAGYLSGRPGFDGVLCLPGTHSKWVEISAGEVVSFRTFMTGELFDLVSRHSVLRHSTGAGWDAAVFAEALGDTLSRPESLAAKALRHPCGGPSFTTFRRPQPTPCCRGS